MAVYPLNRGVKLTTTWTDPSGAAANPDTIALRIRKPDGTIVTKAKADMTSPAIGTWEYTIVADQEGRWIWRAEATGAVTDADERFFNVRDSAFNGA
jgi:hypothetical protein